MCPGGKHLAHEAARCGMPRTTTGPREWQVRSAASGHPLLDRLAYGRRCPVALGDLLRPRPELSLGQAVLPGVDDLVLAPDRVDQGDQRGGPRIRRHLLHQRLGYLLAHLRLAAAILSRPPADREDAQD